MVINFINCSYRTYNYSYATRGPLLVGCWLEASGSCRISSIRARPVCSAKGTGIVNGEAGLCVKIDAGFFCISSRRLWLI